MNKDNHKLGLKFPKTSKCCVGIQVYIDRDRINAIGLYPLDKDKRRIDNLDEFDLEFNVMELEVLDIEDIAIMMNKENFERFCETWRNFHE